MPEESSRMYTPSSEEMTLQLLKIIFPIAAFCIQIVALFAVMDGIAYVFGIPTFWAGVLAFFVAMISPLIASIVGIWGAIYGWGLEWYWAVLLFFWVPVLQLAFGITAVGVMSVAERFKKQ
jgi:hypothetical protein